MQTSPVRRRSSIPGRVWCLALRMKCGCIGRTVTPSMLGRVHSGVMIWLGAPGTQLEVITCFLEGVPPSQVPLPAGQLRRREGRGWYNLKQKRAYEWIVDPVDLTARSQLKRLTQEPAHDLQPSSPTRVGVVECVFPSGQGLKAGVPSGCSSHARSARTLHGVGRSGGLEQSLGRG